MREIGERYLRKIYYNLKTCALWLFMAGLTGVGVGAFSSAFSFCLKKVTMLRGEYPFLLYFLPAGGIVIVLLYHLCGVRQDKGTNIIMTAVHGKTRMYQHTWLPLFLQLRLSHIYLVGLPGVKGQHFRWEQVSVTRLADFLSLKRETESFGDEWNECSLFCCIWNTSCGSDFSYGNDQCWDYALCSISSMCFSSIVANRFAVNMGINPEAFMIHGIPELTFLNSAKIVLLGIFCAGLSVVFCLFLKGAGLFYSKFFKNAYIRAMAGGFLVIGMTLLIGTYDYNGAGTEMIAKAIEGSVPAYAFLLKMLLTALTLAAGYKGGEIVPAFFTGATFGCLFGHVFGISPSLCAATGMLALFCGVTNCPIASMLIGFELFGFEGVPYILIAISISYMLSGYHGLYKEQIIVYSKYHPKFINRQSGDESFDGQDYE